MGFQILIKRIVFILVVCKYVNSLPIDTSNEKQDKSGATLSEYQSLSPPKWPYTPPMKPTRPYIPEQNPILTKGYYQSSPTFSEIVTSYSDSDSAQFKKDDIKISDNEINLISQNYKDDFKTYSQIKQEKKKEKEEFIHALRAILWDAEDNSTDEEDQNQGRQFGSNYSPVGGYGNNFNIRRQQNLLRWHGLMGRPMPQILKRQGLAAQAYRGFEQGCYKLSCTLGINKLISQIGRMLG